MVLLMICEKLLSSSELGWQEGNDNTAREGPLGQRPGGRLRNMTEIQATMGGYRFQCSWEPKCVAKALKAASLKRMCIMFGRLYLLAAFQDWAAHTFLISKLQGIARAARRDELEV